MVKPRTSGPRAGALRAEDLEPRSREVLHEIVLEFVSSGEPISSRSLARHGHFELSPATLRNVMADLEDLGYLSQPHTSAGRIPTDSGYRFFIDHLMRSRRLHQQERAEIDDEVSRVDEVDEMMHLASRLASRMSDQVGMVFMPKLTQLVMRSVDFIPVSDAKVMCVIVGTNGVVMNKIVELTSVPSRDELAQMGRFFSEEYGGLTLERFVAHLQHDLAQERANEDPRHASALETGLGVMHEVVPLNEELCVEGTMSIFNKPEYSDTDSLRRIAVVFDRKKELASTLDQLLNDGGLQILVGSENKFTGSYNASLVVTSYGREGEPLGLVGVMGPTRMEYARMAPLVDYLARALSRKIEETQEDSDS
jgi:heat-inducible transcriptional repressor